jgi:glycosyltransferase involved in cell wall biosynthesis
MHRDQPAVDGMLPAGRGAPRLLFLAWDCPWPANWGGAMRTLGLLTQLSTHYDVELLLLTRTPLTAEQHTVLSQFSRRIRRVPLRGGSRADKVRLAWRSLVRKRPYHCSVIDASFEEHPDLLEEIRGFPGVVYASYGHWGTLVHRQTAPNWVLDQQHSAADFWRVFRSHTWNPLLKVAASVNEHLASRHFKHVYPGLGLVVSVCEEDMALTTALAPHTPVAVIQNGIDCSHYAPNPSVCPVDRSILFVGTDEHRNMQALARLVRQILPRVRRSLSGVRLTVGGNIGLAARRRFQRDRDIVFTGPVEDLRQAFSGSSVFVVPHTDTHGSQLKVAVAMAMGMPIVSTAQGIRGLPLVDGESVLLADDDDDFARCVSALLRDAPRRARLAAAARRAAETHLDWRVLARSLVTMVDDIAVQSATAGARAAGGQVTGAVAERAADTHV